MEVSDLKNIAIRRFTAGAVVLGALFFLSAGTIAYWEAWLFMAVIFGPMILAVRYLLRHDPALAERRLKAREERKKQSALQMLGGVFWLATYLIPGLDQRFGWSSVHWLVAVFGNLAVLVGYVLFFLVLRENSYAARTIAVHESQTVIDTGPYAVVRHPMYSGVLVMILFSPLALGSYWAMIPALFVPVAVVIRIRDEEEMLLEELPGYREYMQKTRYRLIPDLW